MAKEGLKSIVAGLRKAGQGAPVELEQGNPDPSRPLAQALALPQADTQYELDLGLPGPKAYYPKGKVDQPQPLSQGEPKLPVMERQKLNNAMAKAKLGKRLTLAERRLLGKHNLQRIMVRLRPKGGDVG